MNKEEFLKIQKCVLKVNIDCDGCKRKVKKILQKIDGVFTIEIDSEAGKVTVSGNVEPAKLIKKLRKSKKYAQIWGLNPNSNNEIKNLETQNGKGGNIKDPKMLPPQLKGLQIPPNHKGDDLTDEDDFDDDDDYDDHDFDDDLEVNVPNKMMGDSGQIPNINMGADKKQDNNGGTEGKNGTRGNRSRGGGGAKYENYNIDAEINNGYNGIRTDEMGPVMKDAPHGFPNMGGHHRMPNAKMTAGNGARPMGSMSMPLAQMGNMQTSQMVPIPAVQGLPAGLINNHRYFSGPAEAAEVIGGNPYQEHQYTAEMMNQHRAAMVNQPMMYSRPPSAVNYLPPYPYPLQPGIDNYNHYMSDENTSNCNVM